MTLWANLSNSSLFLGCGREIWDFFIFCPNNLYSELFSKIPCKGPEACKFFEIEENSKLPF